MACKCQDAANNTFSCIRRVSVKFNNIFCIFEDDQVLSICVVLFIVLFLNTSRKHFAFQDFHILFQKFIESYDLNDDEYQMTNIGYTMKKGLRHRYRKRLKRMTLCRNAECLFGTNLGSKFITIL